MQVLTHTPEKEHQFTDLETFNMGDGAQKIFFPNAILYIPTSFLTNLSSFGCQVRPFLFFLFYF